MKGETLPPHTRWLGIPTAQAATAGTAVVVLPAPAGAAAALAAPELAPDAAGDVALLGRSL
jgi:hypothetical protein